MKLDVTESTDFGHTDSVEGLGPAALIEDAFKKPVGTIVGRFRCRTRCHLSDHDQKAIDPEQAHARALRRARRSQTQEGAMSNALFMDSILRNWSRTARSKFLRDTIKRVSASYHQ